jgi:hypothetical protein
MTDHTKKRGEISQERMELLKQIKDVNDPSLPVFNSGRNKNGKRIHNESKTGKPIYELMGIKYKKELNHEPNGKFKTGNKAGKLNLGAKKREIEHKITNAFFNKLNEEEIEELLIKAITKAKQGNETMLKMILEPMIKTVFPKEKMDLEIDELKKTIKITLPFPS